MREYEQISGKELDETVKTVTLIEEAPPQLQEHLRLRSEEIGTDYKKVILSIEGYVRPKKSWDSGGKSCHEHWLSQQWKRPAQRQKQRKHEKMTKATDCPKGKAKTKEKEPRAQT